MLCAKFGWNWPTGSGEDENVKSWQRQQTTNKFWSEKLTWAFGSGELKTWHVNNLISGTSPQQRRIYLWSKESWIHFNQGCFASNFSWHWPSDSWEDFQMLIMYLFHNHLPLENEVNKFTWIKNFLCQCIFRIILSFKEMWTFIWTNLKSLHLRMLCAKFGWN